MNKERKNKNKDKTRRKQNRAEDSIANESPPTAADFAELYGSDKTDGNPDGAKHLGTFAAESFTPLSGAAFGPGRNDVTLSGSNRVTNADPINGAVFWSASGDRIWNTGAAQEIGLYGHSRSSTAATSGNGYYLWFSSTNIYPQYSYFRSYAFPVRCIRD